MPVLCIGDFHVLLPLNILSDAKEHRHQIQVSFEIRRLSKGGTSFSPAFPSFFLFFLHSKKTDFSQSFHLSSNLHICILVQSAISTWNKYYNNLIRIYDRHEILN